MTSSINWEATDTISWNSCYVYVCSCALNIFKTIKGAAGCEVRSVIRFLNARNVLPSEIHRQNCQVYGDNVMSDAWLGNGFGCSMKDERTCTMRCKVGVHLWWMVIWCVRVRDDRRFTISDLSLHFLQISRTVLYDIVSSHLGYRWPHSMRRVYKNLLPATISASIIAANTWKNSSNNVESDNNKILCETLIDFFTAKRYLLSA